MKTLTHLLGLAALLSAGALAQTAPPTPDPSRPASRP